MRNYISYLPRALRWRKISWYKDNAITTSFYIGTVYKEFISCTYTYTLQPSRIKTSHFMSFGTQTFSKSIYIFKRDREIKRRTRIHNHLYGLRTVSIFFRQVYILSNLNQIHESRVHFFVQRPTCNKYGSTFYRKSLNKTLNYSDHCSIVCLLCAYLRFNI